MFCCNVRTRVPPFTRSARGARERTTRTRRNRVRQRPMMIHVVPSSNVRSEETTTTTTTIDFRHGARSRTSRRPYRPERLPCVFSAARTRVRNVEDSRAPPNRYRARATIMIVVTVLSRDYGPGDARSPIQQINIKRRRHRRSRRRRLERTRARYNIRYRTARRTLQGYLDLYREFVSARAVRVDTHTHILYIYTTDGAVSSVYLNTTAPQQ